MNPVARQVPCGAVAAAVALSLVSGLSAGEYGAGMAPAIGTAPPTELSSALSFLNFGRRASATNLPPLTVGTLAYRHDFASDFDDLPGDLAVDDISLWAPLPPIHFGDFHLIAFPGYRATWLDGGDESIIPDDDLHAFRLPVTLLYDLSENWLLGAMVMPGYSGDMSSYESDAWTVAAAAGFGYSWSPALRVFAGAFYSHGIDDDDLLVPGVAFTWRPVPDWEVYLLPPLAGVNYSLSDKWLVGVFGRYDPAGWWVSGDNTGDVSAVMDSARVGLKLEGQLWERFWLYGSGGYNFARNIEVKDASGHELLDEDIDAGPFVQVGLNFRF